MVFLLLKSSSPGLTVEVAVADGFGNVLELDALAAVKVGYGAGNLQYAVVCTCREIEPCHCGFEHCKACLVERGVFCNQFWCHLGIAVYALLLPVSLFLYLACGNHALAYCCAWLARRGVRYLLERYRYNLNLQVKAIGYFKVRWFCVVCIYLLAIYILIIYGVFKFS